MVSLRMAALACAVVAFCTWLLVSRQPAPMIPEETAAKVLSVASDEPAPATAPTGVPKIQPASESTTAEIVPPRPVPRLSWDDTSGIPEKRLRLDLTEEDVEELEGSLLSLQQAAHTVPLRDGWELRIRRETPLLARLGLRDGDRITEASLGGDSPSPLARRVRTVLDGLAR